MVEYPARLFSDGLGELPSEVMRMLQGLILILLAASAVGVTTQVQHSPLFAAISTPDYPGETYTSRASGEATRVYFDHESIRFAVTIANRTSSAAALKVNPSADGDIFDFRIESSVAPLTGATMRPNVSRGVKVRSDLVSAELEGNSPISFASGDHARWDVEMPLALPPGTYSLSVDLRGTDGDGRVLLWQVHTITFEIRSKGEAAAEVEYREAMRLLRENDATGRTQAELAISRLLRVNPQSYVAHSLRGFLEEQRGRALDAKKHYERASELLESNADRLFLKFKTPEQVERIKAEMKARLGK